jgi:hypothetical protein
MNKRDDGRERIGISWTAGGGALDVLQDRYKKNLLGFSQTY